MPTPILRNPYASHVKPTESNIQFTLQINPFILKKNVAQVIYIYIIIYVLMIFQLANAESP